MHKLFKRKANDINEKLVLVMNFVLLEEVGMYVLYTAVNFWLPFAQTELKHKDYHCVSGVKLLRLRYTCEGKQFPPH